MYDILLRQFINFAALPAPCDLPKARFGFPTWYKYIPGRIDPVTGKCELVIIFREGQVGKMVGIAVALVEILLVIAGMVAIVYIVYGGFRYVTSQGEPENTKAAQETILNAIIGVVLAIIATTVVRFLGTKL